MKKKRTGIKKILIGNNFIPYECDRAANGNL